MKNISKEILDNDLDGEYIGLRSGYYIRIFLNGLERYAQTSDGIKTTEGIRGINYPVRVKISNGELYIIE